jgi:hypothetical protein
MSNDTILKSTHFKYQYISQSAMYHCARQLDTPPATTAKEIKTATGNDKCTLK